VRLIPSRLVGAPSTAGVIALESAPKSGPASELSDTATSHVRGQAFQRSFASASGSASLLRLQGHGSVVGHVEVARHLVHRRILAQEL
jgi:hypothetical protein